MANPQVENGYTKIANEILDKICLHRISGEEHLILWTIIRKTYGFNKKEDHIALSQFIEYTGMKKQNVWRAINKLVLKKIVVIKKDDRLGNVYIFNKNTDEWIRLSKKITDKSVIKKDDKVSSKKIHTKDNTKDNIHSKKVKGTFLQGNQWNELIDSFKEVNPMYLNFYKNKTERHALEDLAKQIGYEKLLGTIQHLPEIITKPYAPRITTPKELQRGLGKLIAFFKQEKSKTITKTTPNFIL